MNYPVRERERVTPYYGGAPAGGYRLELQTVTEILAEMEAAGYADYRRA